jgi:hypothetical protein
MRYGIIVSLLVLLTIVSVVVPFTFPIRPTPAVQDNRHEQLILSRAAAAIHNAEPEWQYIPAICNGSSDHISVDVFGVATAGAAARLIYGRTHRNYGNGWSVTSYKLGDDANMATYLDAYRGLTQYSMTVRKGRFLAMLNGQSKEAVERFAPFLVTEMSR